MKLIKCPECYCDISLNMENCQNCGFPINEVVIYDYPADINTNKTISKKWLSIHVIISMVISIILVFANYLINYDDIEYENVLFSDVMRISLEYSIYLILTYWLSVFCISIILSGIRKNYISIGWVRLHIIMSILGGIVVSAILWLIGNNNLIFYSSIWWPFTYWVIVVIFIGIVKFNDGFLPKDWLGVYSIISLLVSFITYYVTNNQYCELDNELELLIPILFGELSVICMWLGLFVFVWLKNGFSKSEQRILKNGR